jgi:DNA-binding winged helix-turn-helix (wHTH) protein
VRYRFGPFLLSPAGRVLLAEGRPVSLIPRYFDLLVLLVEQRDRAVGRQEIFDRVWADVVVSDGALSQAVRTVRRALGDTAQTPQYIRTVSRHGYQFVAAHVVTEPDVGPVSVDPVRSRQVGSGALAGSGPTGAADDVFVQLLDTLLRAGSHQDATEEERYDAAVALHELGTEEALRRLGDRPGHEAARAIMRDARWDAAGAGPVPLLRSAGRLVAVVDVLALRVRHASRLASARWAAASVGGGAAGALAGLAGGVALGLTPGSHLDAGVTSALVIIGTLAGIAGASGVGGGLAAAEAVSRSARASALTAAGAAGGLAAGFIAHHASRAVLSAVFGRDVPVIGGGLEGLVLGGAVGAGYALATRRLLEGGMAAPRGVARWRAAAVVAAAAMAAGITLSWAGRQLVASSLDLVAGMFAGSGVGLEGLARLLGEGRLRPVTRMIVSGFEAGMLGLGLSYGLMHRPRASRKQEPENPRTENLRT